MKTLISFIFIVVLFISACENTTSTGTGEKQSNAPAKSLKSEPAKPDTGYKSGKRQNAGSVSTNSMVIQKAKEAR